MCEPQFSARKFKAAALRPDIAQIIIAQGAGPRMYERASLVSELVVGSDNYT